MRVCAVSYLNTVPLVWGLTRGPQRNIFDLSFAVPSACAAQLECGDTDIGLVPCAEIDRLQLEYLPETGIACRGPVRSILLISKCSPDKIRTLAADLSSRSSIMLSRIIVAERYGATPQVVSLPPDLDTMLAHADAALIIGDPALAIDPEHLPYLTLDLGAEWVQHTGLPMVFAVWAGRPAAITPEAGRVFAASLDYGLQHIDAIVEDAARSRNVSAGLARKYLTEHIAFQLGPREHEGLKLFRLKVAELRCRDEAASGILVR